MGRIVTFRKLGRNLVWDELSLGTNCRLGRIVAWDELSLGTNCRWERIVAQPSFTCAMDSKVCKLTMLPTTVGTNESDHHVIEVGTKNSG